MERKMVIKIILLIFIIVALGVISYVSDTAQLLDHEAMQEVIEDNLIIGVLLFVTTATLLKLLFVPVIPISIAAGFLFGGTIGTLASLASITLGASIPFTLSRYLGSDFIHRVFRRRLAALKEHGAFMAKHGVLPVLFFRVVPILPNMVVNLGFGLTRVKVRDFILGTVLGSIPGAFLLANFGNTVTDYTDPQPYIFAALYIALVITAAVWGYRIKKRGDSEK
jgi:uncharacterized membrane protein YdjX (TVP38/TMEM64 family)